MAYRKLAPRTTPAPTSLTAVGDVSFVRLSWALTSPPFDFTRFDIYRDGSLLANTTATSYDDTTATDGVTYTYTIKTVRTNPRSSQAYSSAASSSANGGWASTPSSSVDIVSVTNSTSGSTIVVNAVTGADHYRLYRSTDPLTGFSQVGSDSATTTLSDTTGTAGTLYFYKVAPVTSGVAGTQSRSRVGSKLGTSVGAPITLGTLTLTPNYHTIHIDQAVTGDADESAAAWAEFSDGTTWRHTIVPLMRRGTSFIGAAVELDPGTPYTVQVTVTDSGGVSGANTASGSKSTRADESSTHAAIKAAVTRYVNFSTGNDTTGTGLSGAPWKTIDKAVQVANAGSLSGAVVQVAAGYQPAPATQLTASNIDFVAENAAVGTATGTDYAPYNTGSAHTIVYGRFTAPTASDLSDDAVNMTYNIYGKGGWTAYTPSGTSYTVYGKDIGASDISQVGYTVAADYASYTLAKAAEPKRLADIAKDGTAGRLLNTLDGFCEFIHTNLSYNAGFWQNSTTLYVRLPGGINPNNCYLWMSRYAFSSSTITAVFDIAGSNVRIAGFNARHLANGFRFRSAATDVVCLRNYTHDCGCPYAPYKNANGVGALRVTIQDFRSDGTNSWNEDLSGIPWEAIKQQYAMAYTGSGGDTGVTFYTKNRITSGTEISVVKFNQGGAQFVIRRGEVKGIFNGFGSTGASTAVGAQRDIDIHDIRFSEVADNCIEPEGMATSWVCWNHEMKNCRSYLSTDSDGGAHIFYRIQGWQWGNHGIAPIVAGETSLAEFRGGNGQLIKFGAGASPRPHYWLINITAWTNKSGSRGWGKGIGSSSAEHFHHRNIILRATDDVVDNQATITTWDSDYNLFGSEAADAGTGVMLKNVLYNSTSTTGANSLAAARTAGVMGANDNKHNGTDYNFVAGGQALIDSLIGGRLSGDLSLTTASDGHPWPNISDDGSTPSRGYEG